jgi:hypothetical protein
MGAPVLINGTRYNVAEFSRSSPFGYAPAGNSGHLGKVERYSEGRNLEREERNEKSIRSRQSAVSATM